MESLKNNQDFFKLINTPDAGFSGRSVIVFKSIKKFLLLHPRQSSYPLCIL